MDKKILEQFAEFPIPSYDDWRKVTEASLKGASFERKLVTNTYEGISLQPMYQKQDAGKSPLVQNYPGSPPYTRGTTSHNSGWEISQELRAAVPKRFNEIACHDLSKGQTALNIILDRATMDACDLDMLAEEPGNQGLLLTHIEDVQTALKGIDLSRVPLYIHAGANSLPLLALLAAHVETPNLLHGCVAMDPIHELVTKGSLFYDLDNCYDVMKDVTGWATQNAPSLKTVLVQGEAYHNGGANAVQELALVLAAGTEYVQALTSRGLDINTASAHIQFSFAIGSDYFMEVAKLRAARTLWSAIVEAFGGNEEAQKMSIHARTSAYTKTVYDPYVNMLRATTEAFSAAVGGADSIHVSPFDEAIQKSTAFSRRIARNASIILKEEAHIAKTTDPAGGSWYVENLTNQLAEKAWSLFQEVEEKGGILEVLKEALPQEQIEEVAKKRLDHLAHRQDVLVGTNMYANVTEKPLDVLAEDETSSISEYIIEHKQRPIHFVERITTVEDAIQAAKEGSSIATLAKATGKKTEATITIRPVEQTRASMPFEQLRKQTESYEHRTGEKVNVFLANLGPIPEHKARADFAAGFMEVGGFHVIRNNGFLSVEKASEAAIDSGASIIVICGKDETYQQQAAALAKILKKEAPQTSIILAGKPSEDDEKSYRQAGISTFIHMRANCYEILHQLQVEKGVSS